MNQVKQIIAKHKISRRELSRYLRVSHVHVLRWEKGETKISYGWQVTIRTLDAYLSNAGTPKIREFYTKMLGIK